MVARFSLRPLADPGAAMLLVGVAIWAARATWFYAGIDLYNDYLPWFAHIERVGVIAAFSAQFGSYAPPYLYLLAAATPLAPAIPAFSAVKLVSYLGHVLLAVAVKHLLSSIAYRRPWTGAAIVALAPSLFINPAVLVQCDAYWAAALVAALTAALERRHARMFLWCGLAVGFKLQAIFLAPVFLALALADRAPWRWWPLAPAAYGATLLPAWIDGWPAADLVNIYFRQASFTSRLSLAAPNVWTLIEASPASMLPGVALLGTGTAAFASISYVWFFARRLRDAPTTAVLHAACLGALIVPGLLPHMHERYFFMADLLSIILALAAPRWWPVAILVQLGSFAAIWSYLTGATGLASLGAAAMMVATWLALRPWLSAWAPGASPHEMRACA